MNNSFEVIVIGGGHAGCEAALAAARLGATTLLLTQNLDTIGHLSCNPAIGGIGKGHLVREIDALGGVMGRLADQAGIQFRLLNRGKGPAVRGPRAQIDRIVYRRLMRETLEQTPGLTLRQAEAIRLNHHHRTITGVDTDWGETCTARAVVVTTGTFLRGLAHMGERSFPAGRLGERESGPLATSLSELGVVMGRLKTGTPPRLDGRTIHWEQLERQEGDEHPVPFSFLTREVTNHQLPCHLTHTNAETHAIIRDNLHRAPLYTGQITGRGPRYCPSIEDKVVRFAERDRHQVFLEPEGRHTSEIYPNGISTSLPIDVQWRLVRSLRGLEEVQILRPGYAIEYDMADPRQLNSALGWREGAGLYLAGQINGTTGYEEAAAQGLAAGINAARFARQEEPIHFDRAGSYLGVLIDDLITRGVDEPYRMFTSRAEFRLLLRVDNADARLTPLGRAIGLVDEARWQRHLAKQNAIDAARRHLQSTLVTMEDGHPTGTGHQRLSGWELLRRQQRPVAEVARMAGLEEPSAEVLEALEVESLYQGFLERQDEEVIRFRQAEGHLLPVDLDWEQVSGLSVEARQKLALVRPETIGQAQRIPGITPATISALLVHLKRR